MHWRQESDPMSNTEASIMRRLREHVAYGQAYDFDATQLRLIIKDAERLHGPVGDMVVILANKLLAR